MKYDLDWLTWQDFEILVLKILKIYISTEVIFIEWWKDKGRDMIFLWRSNTIFEWLSWNWVFQSKHKSKIDDSKLKKELVNDLKNELEKVFIKNKLACDIYVFITNKTLSWNILDELKETFEKFTKNNSVWNKEFRILSYRDLEEFIDKNKNLVWDFPHIIKHVDFLEILKSVDSYKIENRKRGWLNNVEKNRQKFVHTSFYSDAYKKLRDFSAIILSWPPKSWKTFNAEILAINLCAEKNFQPILIESPEDLENCYKENLKQIFVLDDAFGKFCLTTKVEDWYKKIDRVFSLVDENHLFIFTSREYILRAFINYWWDSTISSSLSKIIVESHDYSREEKIQFLEKYTFFSNIKESDKLTILYFSDVLVSHKNFSPETVRAFFWSIVRKDYKDIYDEFRKHLNEPDEYLSSIFSQLSENKKAALVSVLCCFKNNKEYVYKTFSQICSDLEIKTILNSDTEFTELDDSILKIQRAKEIEWVEFYHPSMQEFLIKLFTSNKVPKLREIILKNINFELLDLSLFKWWWKCIIPEKSKLLSISLWIEDIKSLKTWVKRILENNNISLSNLSFIFSWFRKDSHTTNLKFSDKVFYEKVKDYLEELISIAGEDSFYKTHIQNSASSWWNFFWAIKKVGSSYDIKLENKSFEYIKSLLKEKENEEWFWVLALNSINLTNEKNIVWRDWLNSFYFEIRKTIYTLGNEVYWKDFPDFKDYLEKRKKDPFYEKMKEKPNRTWYPRFLDLKEKMCTLKEMKWNEVWNIILERLSKEYQELINIGDFAKNRHWFNTTRWWWKI